MGSNAFSDFIHDTELTDEEACTRAEIDMAFITSNLSGPKCKANAKRFLLRFQFMEALVTLALTKYWHSKILPTPAAAVVKVLEDHLSHAQFRDSQSYRRGTSESLEELDEIQNHGPPTQQLYTKEHHLIFQSALEPLETLFQQYLGHNALGPRRS